MASRIDKLRNVIGVDSVLNRIQDLDILLERILLEARRVLRADAGSIYIKQGDKLAVTYSQNDTKAAELKPGEKLIYNFFTVPIGPGTTSGYAAFSGEPVNVSDVYDIPDEAPYSFDPSYDKMSGYRTKSTLSIPLTTNMGDLLGVLQVLNKKDKISRSIPFSKDDELIAMHFATNATVALQRAQMTRQILLRMTRMAELRDPTETGTHVLRVAGYATEIYERWATKEGKPAREIESTGDNLRMAAMLHDVGKVAISDMILKKKGRFDETERDIMKSHTWRGAQLFKDKQSEFDELALIVSLNHHEHWDGKGYPGHIDFETGKPLKTDADGNAIGKKGDEIPIMGRIVALADVYDALRSNRIYKEAWTEDDTLKEIKAAAGTQFDPTLVDVFFEVLPNIQQVAARFSKSDTENEGDSAKEPDPT